MVARMMAILSLNGIFKQFFKEVQKNVFQLLN